MLVEEAGPMDENRSRSGIGLRVVGLICILAMWAPTMLGEEAAETRTDRKHLIYLHGKIVEGSDGRPSHPRHGVYDFPAIVAALESPEVTVVAEIRPAGQSIEDAAKAVIETIDSLLQQGIRTEEIAVAGVSRGGIIAQMVSERMQRQELSFVILAGCFPGAPSYEPLAGRFLSIYDRSDQLAVSCEQRFAHLAGRPGQGEDPTEIILDVGRGHGLFYQPDQRWIGPLQEWLRE